MIKERLRKMKIGDIEVWAMANFRPKSTGIPMVIWIIPKSGKEKHGPRIKVQNNYNDVISPGSWFSVTIEEIPKVVGSTKEIKTKDIKKAISFVKKNLGSLKEYWNGLLTTDDLLEKIIKV